MNDESDSRMVRLPVRDMRDEPAPQRAAQEGDLPPLLTDEQIQAIGHRSIGAWVTIQFSSNLSNFARAIESEVRTAIAAAGGRVPNVNSVQRRAAHLHIKACMPWSEAEQLALSEAGIDDKAIDELIGECGYMGLESLLTTPDELRRFTRSVLVHQPLASSPQPEAAQPNLVDDEGVMNTPLLRAARLLVSGSHPSKDCAGPYMVPADLWLTLQAEVMESLRQAAARDLANPVQPKAAPAVAQVPKCKCGQPWILNTVHREHSPCWRAADPVDGLAAPQPEAAPAVAQVPIGYVSEQQLPLIKDPDDESGHYIPMRKTPAGNFTMALYAAAPEAPAQAEATDWILAMGHALGLDSGYSVPIVPSVDEFKRLFAEIRRRAVAEGQQAAPSAGEVGRVLRSFEIAGPDADGLLWLVLHGNGTTGKAMFQLGLPDRLAGQVALMLEQDRRAALSHKEPQR